MFDWYVTPSEAREEVGRARRDLLKRSSVVAALAVCGLLAGRRALAAVDEAAFSAASTQEMLERLGGIPAAGSQIVLKVPEIAENGAAVPVLVECTLPRLQAIFIVVEGNPVPLAARFTIPEGTEPFVSLRVKMAQSSRLYAVVQADGELYWTARETKVAVGGCA